MSKRIVVIGNGSFATNCLRVAVRHNDADVRLVLTDPESRALGGLVQNFCTDSKIECIESTNVNDSQIIGKLARTRPHILISAYNMQILKQELLSIPSEMTINFHNGPLPRYRGVNVFSWAIANGESQYGVTWHEVDAGIDTGGIIGQQMFDLDVRESPLSLMRKSFAAGVSLFEEILPGLLAGEYEVLAQDNSQATYYSKTDIPNDGKLDFAWTVDRIHCFMRALDFRPLENPMGFPAASFCGSKFFAQAAFEVSEESHAMPGTIIAIDERGLQVQASDGVIGLGSLLDAAMRPIESERLAESLEMRPGQRMDT